MTPEERMPFSEIKRWVESGNLANTNAIWIDNLKRLIAVAEAAKVAVTYEDWFDGEAELIEALKQLESES